MTDAPAQGSRGLHGDIAPGDEIERHDISHAIRGYLIGLALATLLTGVSFYVASASPMR